MFEIGSNGQGDNGTSNTVFDTANATETKPELQVLVGESVLDLLADKIFLQRWDALYLDCPWSTVFQSKEFVATWYKLYHKEHLPILVIKTEGTALTGLLTLAKDTNGQITGAGLNQAEYQVWLAKSNDNSTFIKHALSALRSKYPGSSIVLKYVPAATPLSWAETESAWRKVIFKRVVKQPLLIINKDYTTQELRKKNRREKINRLKRLGELSFEKITDSNRLDAVLDELAIQSDFRKGAMYNKRVFQNEPIRKTFLKELFEQKALHVTLLKLDEEIIASNAGITGKNWVHLQGINTHSPVHSKHSPGIMHFLMLCNLLAEENIKVFDLTPGASSYKDALATDYTEAHELYFDSSRRIATKSIANKLNEYLKEKLPTLGVQQSKVKDIKFKASLLKEKIKHTKGQSLLLLAKYAAKRRRTTIFQLFDDHTSKAPVIHIINKDCLRDLLNYQSKGSATTTWEFLMEAMKRFEKGQHVYTWSNKECLLACVWLTKPNGLENKAIPDGADVFENFYLHPDANSQLAQFVKAVTEKVGTENGATTFYAMLDGRNPLLEKGFKTISTSSF